MYKQIKKEINVLKRRNKRLKHSKYYKLNCSNTVPID